MSTATKSIVVELNRGDKLNGDNYKVWMMKIQYVLEEQEVLKVLDVVMKEPEAGTTAQHKRDREAFDAWKRKNSIARITMLSSMDDDIMREFRKHGMAMDIWSALKSKFGETSVTRLRSLTIRFDTYKKLPNDSMRKHLRKMSNMVTELKDVGHVLTDEQQVQAVIHSLPTSWDQLKMHLTHNEGIKNMEDVGRHLELEEERLEAAKPSTEVYVAGSSSHGGFKRKHHGKTKEWDRPQKKAKEQQAPRKQQKRKRNMAKVKCFKCFKLGHFARKCTEAKVPSFYTSYMCVSSSMFLVESDPLWIVDSGATDHIARDREAFEDFRRISSGTKWIFVGNNSKVEVKGIGTCKIDLHGGRTLILQDVLYAPDIRRNIVSVVKLLNLGYKWIFHDNCVDLYFDSSYFGSGYIYEGFFVLSAIYDCLKHSVSLAATHQKGDNVEIWHSRLGHIGQSRMNRLAKEGLLTNISKVEKTTCEHCLIGKTCRKPFGTSKRSEHPLQIIHSDICGPLNVKARHDASYFITLSSMISRDSGISF